MGGAKFERGGSDLENLVRERIKARHEHLREANIGILKRTTEWQSRGEPVLGDVSQVSGRERFWAEQVEEIELDFLLILNWGKWQDLAPEQKTALLDHLLLHCERGEDKKDGSCTWRKAHHDFEGFRKEIQWHGLWMPNLRKMAEAVMERGGEVQQTLVAVAKDQGLELEPMVERPEGRVMELGEETAPVGAATNEHDDQGDRMVAN